MQKSEKIINIIKKIFPWIAGLAGILVFGFLAEAIESSDNLIKLSIAVVVIWGINHFLFSKTSARWDEKYKELLLETKKRQAEWIRISDKLEKINKWRGGFDLLDSKDLYDNNNYINNLEREIRLIRMDIENTEDVIDKIEEKRSNRLEEHINLLELLPEFSEEKRVTSEMIENWKKQISAENMKRKKETKDILEMKNKQEKI